MFKSTLQKVSWIAMGVVLMGAALLTSCQSDSNKIPPLAPTNEISNVVTDVGKTGTDLKGTTATIETNATQGMQMTPAQAQSVLNKFWTAILQAVGVQKQIIVDLANTEDRAQTAETQSKKFEQDYNTEHALRLKAEDSTTKELKEKFLAYSGILFFISLIAFGLAVWSNGNKLAMWGGIITGVGSAVCIFIVQIVSLIPWIIGGLALAAIGVGIYTYLHNKGLLNVNKAKALKYEKATNELVETLESAKPKMSLEARRLMFGDGPQNGEAFHIQSRDTEEVVKDIRKKIRLAPSIPLTIATDYITEDNSNSDLGILVAPKTLMKRYVLK